MMKPKKETFSIYNIAYIREKCKNFFTTFGKNLLLSPNPLVL